jgi:hypothetical protein
MMIRTILVAAAGLASLLGKTRGGRTGSGVRDDRGRHR